MEGSSSPSKIPPPKYGEKITVLSVDGGGIRGIICGVILGYLESQLKEKWKEKVGKDEDVRLAHFFDVIAGTSTGGLITAMLTAPDVNGLPLYAATRIVSFYIKKGPEIFPQTSCGCLSWIVEIWKALTGSKYDGTALHNIIEENLKDKRLHETVTNVVIPTFDIKKLQPTIFSSYQLECNPHLDAKLSDICIGTSAAPTYFPAYFFKNPDDKQDNKNIPNSSRVAVNNLNQGNEEDSKFNLIDGGIAANNPTLIAISEVIKQITMENPDFPSIESLKSDKRLVVISIGTGSKKREEKYDAEMASKWGVIGWSTPIIDCFQEASADMVDYHISVVFQAFQCQDNYLRIQDDTLKEKVSSMDLATEDNIKMLKRIGDDLLKKNVSRINLNTGIYEEVISGGSTRTYEEALQKFAQMLVDERHERLKRAMNQGKETDTENTCQDQKIGL